MKQRYFMAGKGQNHLVLVMANSCCSLSNILDAFNRFINLSFELAFGESINITFQKEMIPWITAASYLWYGSAFPCFNYRWLYTFSCY